MNILKPLILLVLFLLATGCASVGPTVVVETPQPAEDIVLVCTKSKDYLLNIHSTSYAVDYNVGVVKSGEPFDCGVLITGRHSGVSVMHPIYVGDRSQNYEKDGVEHIVLNKTKLDLLDEQKAKFEAGYWDKFKWPGSEYANSLSGCGFDNQYFEYYSEVKGVDVEHFKGLYNTAMLQCMKRSLAIRKKYLRGYKNFPTAEEWMNKLWSSDTWSKYK